MQITLAVLADAANLSREGKLNILGVFDAIYAPKFPVVHPKLQVVLRLAAGVGETAGRKHLELHLIDADGRKLLQLGGELVLPELRAGEPFLASQIITLNNLRLERPGEYRFDIFADGRLLGEIPLRAIEQRPG
jgi:hypothetical protein